MNPYPILAGVIVIVVAVFFGVHIGKRLDHDELMKERSAIQLQAINDVQAEVAKRERDRKFYESNARKATSDHEKALAAVGAMYAAPTHRLRISASVCDAKTTGTGEAASAGRPDETSPGTILLPERIDHDLRSMTKRADEQAEQLRALQGWIKANGFYGDVE